MAETASSTSEVNLAGIGASPGIAVGPVTVLRELDVEVPTFDDPLAAATEAVGEVAKDLIARSGRAREKGRDDAADVLQAQSMMAEDPMLIDSISTHLSGGASLGDALAAASDELEAMLASLPDPYLAARAADVVEVAQATKRQLAGVNSDSDMGDEPRILVAAVLTAAETADLDPEMVLGFVTEQGGPTSHVAIIARSIGVPAVVGVAGLVDRLNDDETIALDGSSGEIVVSPSSEVEQDFADRREAEKRMHERIATIIGSKVTFAGRPVAVAANVGGTADIQKGSDVGADGVGLFRTEFLFHDRPAAPSEEEQYEVYKEAAESFDETVVVRTFDIGGDKPVDYLQLPEEENPFLGQRGVRLYNEFDEMFATQIRAALRAAKHGKIALMIPMVATAAEFRRTRDRIEQVRAELGADAGSTETGVMVEVPSLAVTAHTFASEVDFFSIGTNDLTQYTLAADRTSAALGPLQDALHPAVVELCRTVVRASQPHGTRVSVCGLAAADPMAASVYAAIGVNKLSVTPAAVNLIKATVDAQTEQLVEVVDEALRTSTEGAEFRAAVQPHLEHP